MIEEQGLVIAAEEGIVWVGTERKTSCVSCSAQQGCGQHLLEKYKSSSAFAYIQAHSEWSLSEGDRVMIGIPEKSLLKASMVVYLLPLLLLMIALCGSMLAGFGDGLTFVFCALALMAGFLPARKLSGRESEMCCVKVVSVLSREDPSVQSLSIRSL